MRRFLPGVFGTPSSSPLSIFPFLGILAGWGTGCAVLVHPAPEHAAWAALRWPDSSLESLQLGRETYVQRCSGCHNLVIPARHPEGEWPGLVDKMMTEEEVELTPSEKTLLLRYLQTASAVPPPEKAK